VRENPNDSSANPSKGSGAKRAARQLLVEAVRVHLMPALLQRGFVAAPLVHRGPVDREFVRSLPLGRLRRPRAEGAVDLVELDFAGPERAAFRILVGIAPAAGLDTITGHWGAGDLYVGWLPEYFEMYAWPRFRRWFSVWHWPHELPPSGAYEDLAVRVAKLLPEVDLALTDGRPGRHMRLVRIPRATRSA
jgi:hypothetical protein